jgi:hypothetical protein
LEDLSMRATSPPLLASILGWKDVELDCQRTAERSLPTCTINESLAMRLYTRTLMASNLTSIGCRTGTAQQTSVKTGMVTVHPSTMVFDSTSGEVPIGHVTSAIDHSAERELILKTRAFLNNPEALRFHHETSLHSLFGYPGLVGVLALLWVLVVVLGHHLRRVLQ